MLIERISGISSVRGIMRMSKHTFLHISILHTNGHIMEQCNLFFTLLCQQKG